MKEIKIVIDSICLGDTLSWIPYVDKLQKETNHKVYLACNYSDLFEKEYKNIHFVKADETYLINQGSFLACTPNINVTVNYSFCVFLYYLSWLECTPSVYNFAISIF